MFYMNLRFFCVSGSALIVSACGGSGSNSGDEGLDYVSNSELTGTWSSENYDYSRKWFHIFGEGEALTVTGCSSQYRQSFSREDDLLVGEPGAGYWHVVSEGTLHTGNGEITAVKVDSKPYFSFGDLNITIGDSELTALNTYVETSEICWIQPAGLGGGFVLYAKDDSSFSLHVHLYGAELVGEHNTENGAAYIGVTWNSPNDQPHVEWFESGGLECSYTDDESILCDVDGELVLSGSIKGQLFIDSKYFKK